ncbi:MAG: acetyl-CoA hydrolase/transferase C-terminal domain-containing protein [Acidobacteriia bacterium]|nr:acetyl-CoA hydrolase/transferase C-terminal domain-containing protein [Terriglobia bacterium]
MNWISDYKQKLMHADQALDVVTSKDRVYIHPGCAEPEILVEALISRAPNLRDVEIVHLLTLGNADYIKPEMEGHFRHNAMFVGGNVRQAVNEGRADYTPIFLGEIEALFTTGALPIDVALIQVSPPDEHGFCSFGVGVDTTLTACQVARTVIAHVNDQMPRTLGDAFIHVRKIDRIVEDSRPVLEIKPVEISELHSRIGKHVADLIEDGSTLQLGIGGIPDAALSFMHSKKHLGIHSEMFSDSVVGLVEAGVINNEKKTLHPGKITAGFMLGTRKLFSFVDNNPLIELHPTRYINDPFIISQNDRMVAINSAIQVDLTGQVCADSLGHSIYSGIGGQVDFLRGAARSKGGKPIIALPATAKDGSVSRIVPRLDPGAGVVTSRGDVHYVVTEFGVAYLHGKNIRQRCQALIEIAHPKFRNELSEFAVCQKWLPQCVPVPAEVA